MGLREAMTPLRLEGQQVRGLTVLVEDEAGEDKSKGDMEKQVKGVGGADD